MSLSSEISKETPAIKAHWTQHLGPVAVPHCWNGTKYHMDLGLDFLFLFVLFLPVPLLLSACFPSGN